MTKRSWKGLSIILSLSLITGFIYNAFSQTGIDFIYSAEKLQDGEIVSLEKTKLIFDEKGALFIDARPMYSYQRGFIPGAINVPYSSKTKEALMKDYDKDTNIIVYCYSRRCNQARILARDLKELGYTNVAIFDEGISAWKKAKYPVTSVNDEKRI